MTSSSGLGIPFECRFVVLGQAIGAVLVGFGQGELGVDGALFGLCEGAGEEGGNTNRVGGGPLVVAAAAAAPADVGSVGVGGDVDGGGEFWEHAFEFRETVTGIMSLRRRTCRYHA